MPKEKLHHILEAQQFSRQWLEEEFFPEVDYIRQLFKLGAKSYSNFLKGKSVCVLFYEPSSRTRISFGQAAGLMGAHVESTSEAKKFSSAAKGESLKDFIRTVSDYHFDAIVLRSDYVGGAHDAAKVSSEVPIINAGDGPGQHPTQALLDVATIRKFIGTLDGLNVTLVGDLKNGRTVRSLAYLLSKFHDNHLSLVAPRSFQMKPDILEKLSGKVSFSQHSNLLEIAQNSDVIYMTRLQTERIPYMKKLPLSWQFALAKRFMYAKDVSINEAVMEKVRDDAIIMHPLPGSEGFDELPERFTDDPRVRAFRKTDQPGQTGMGLYTRMALLKMLLG